MLFRSVLYSFILVIDFLYGSYAVPSLCPQEIDKLKSHSTGRYAMVPFLRGRHLFYGNSRKNLLGFRTFRRCNNG